MSATTSGTTSGESTIEVVEGYALSIMPMLTMLFAGKVGPIGAQVQAEIGTLNTEAVALLTEGKTALDNLETSNPAVGKLVQIVTTGMNGLGLTMPTEDQVFTHLLAAVNDLFGAVKTA